jgi:hypothetical protein
MTDEERGRTMDFILVQQAKYSIDLEKLIEAHRRAESGQAKNSVGLEKLIEAHRRAENRLSLTEQRLDRDEYRLDRDERILKLMITAGRRERGIRAKSDQRLTNALAELAEAHKRTEASIAHTDSKLDALVDIVRQRMNGGHNSDQ